jgi:hypothetical protein
MHADSRLTRRFLNGYTLRQQLAILVVLGSLQLGYIVFSTWKALDEIGRTGDITNQLGLALQYHQDADMIHDALRS